MDGALFTKVARFLNSMMASFSLFSISYLFLSLGSSFLVCKYRNVYALPLMANTNVVICLAYYYPCVSQFLTTQKEGENGMIFDSFEMF